MKAWIFAVLVALAVGMASCNNSRNSQTVPTSKVVVQRSPQNEPSIKVISAPNGDADLLLAEAQGYEESKDRFFPMDVARRRGTCRMAEIFGEKAEKQDRETLAVGLWHGVERKTKRLMNEFPQEYRLLEAFAAGVNRYIAEMPNSKEGRKLLAYYRNILTGDRDYVPTPWAPSDTIAIAQNIAFFLSSNLQEKLLLGNLGIKYAQRLTGKAKTAFKIGIDKFAGAAPTAADAFSDDLRTFLDLRPLYPSFILDTDRAQNPWRHRLPVIPLPAIPPAPARVTSLSEMPADGFSFPCLKLSYPFPECIRRTPYGSNNWVVSPEFTGTGETFVANDVHPIMTQPMQFYAIALDSKNAVPNPGTLRVRGFHLAGIPGVLIGHNDFFGWGLTNLGADVDDVYLDKLDPTGKFVETLVAGVATWVPITEEYFPIQVRHPESRGRLEVKMAKVRWVPHHGPVFTDGFPEHNDALKAVSDFYGGNFVATYRWTGHEATAEFAAMIGVNRAKNFSEFKGALDNFGTGAQNMVYGDITGNIGYYAHGNFPVRKYAADWVPYYPTLGAGTFEWEKEFRVHIPELYNPPRGRIVTANNDPYGQSEKPQLSGYADYFGFNWSTGTRAHRIETMLDAVRGNANEAAMAKIQFDHHDGTIAILIRLLDAFRADLKYPAGSEEANVVDRLIGFSGDMSRYETVPLLADLWSKQLLDSFLEKTMTPEVITAAEPLKMTSIIVKHIYHVLSADLRARLWSPVAFHRSIMILKDSVTKVLAKYRDENLSGVNWGKVHRLSFFNPLENILPAALTLLLERDGSFESIDVAGNGIGPNFRMIMTMKPGQPIRAITSVAGGNFAPSDKSAIYDELSLWNEGKYRDFVGFIP